MARRLKRSLLHGFLLVLIWILIVVAADSCVGVLLAPQTNKAFLPAIDGTSNCYPFSFTGEYTHNLWNPISRIAFRRLTPLDGPSFRFETRNRPLCVYQNLTLRRQGFLPEANHNITIVGDSFTQGEGVPDDGNLGWFISQMYGVNVLNYGSSGNDVLNVLDTIEELKDTDGVIYFYNLNDHTHMMNIWSGNDFENIRAEETASPSKIISQIKKIEFQRLATKNSIEGYIESYFSPENEAATDTVYAVIKSMHDELAKRNISFQVVIYPLLFNDPSYPFAAIHYQILAFCNNQNISCIDGRFAFSDVEDWRTLKVHRIDYHPNSEADRMMISYLAEQPDFLLHADT